MEEDDDRVPNEGSSTMFWCVIDAGCRRDCPLSLHRLSDDGLSDTTRDCRGRKG